jgi:hypothetical protein
LFCSALVPGALALFYHLLCAGAGAPAGCGQRSRRLGLGARTPESAAIHHLVHRALWGCVWGYSVLPERRLGQILRTWLVPIGSLALDVVMDTWAKDPLEVSVSGEHTTNAAMRQSWCCVICGAACCNYWR